MVHLARHPVRGPHVLRHRGADPGQQQYLQLRSLLNLFDFGVVFLCVVSIPIYWVAPDWILSIVLLCRFIVRALRIVTVIRRQKFRKEYNDARDAIVDFTKFDEQNLASESAAAVANDRSEQFL